MIYEAISRQATRVVQMADLKAVPVVMRREMELLQDQVDKLPAPPRLPQKKRKEKWGKL